MAATTDWREEQRDAYNELLEEGTLLTIERKHKQPPDPITGRMEEVFVERFEAPGIFITNHNKDYRFYGWGYDLFSRDDNPPQSLRLQGTDTLVLAALTYPKPLILDEVTINDIVWTVSGVFTVQPGMVPVLHYLTIKMN